MMVKLAQAYFRAKTPKQCTYRPTLDELFSFAQWVAAYSFEHGPTSLEKIAVNIPKYRDEALFCIANPHLAEMFYAFDWEFNKTMSDPNPYRGL